MGRECCISREGVPGRTMEVYKLEESVGDVSVLQEGGQLQD